jgi:hypothetical protein
MKLKEATEIAEENDLVFGDRPKRFLGDYYRFAVINAIGTLDYIQKVEQFVEYKEKRDALSKEVHDFIINNKLGPLRQHFDLDSYLVAGIVPKKDMEEGYYLGKCRNAIVAYWDPKSKMFEHTRVEWNLRYTEKIPHLEEPDYNYDLFIPIRKLEDSEVNENVRIDKWKDGVHIDQKDQINEYLDRIEDGKSKNVIST